VVTASDDGTARVRRADGVGTPVELRGYEGPVQSAAFSSDGTILASAGDDGKVILWNVERQRPLAILAGHL